MEEERPGQSLKQKTAKGFFWGGVSSLLYQLISLGFGLVLARRYLSEGDYGIVAILTAFSSISLVLQDSGFSVALINKKEATDRDYNAVFWFNVLSGLFLYLLFFALSPQIAAFFEMPELAGATRIMMLCLVFNGFGATHNTLLVKNLMLREKAIIDTVAFALSCGIGLSLAAGGYGYWSLVFQNGFNGIFYMSLRWYFSPWRPTLKIDLSPLKKMFSFSVKLLMTSLFTSLNNNFFSFLLGYFFNKTVTGFYYQGFKWVNTVYFLISNMNHSVSQSVLARVAHDDDRQMAVFAKMVRLVSMISFPLMLGLCLVSREFILLLITDKWAPSIPYMQLFCLWGMFMPLNSIYTNAVVSCGKSNLYMRGVVSLGVTQFVAAWLILRFTGEIMLMLGAYVTLTAVWFVVWNVVAGRLMRFSVWQMLWRNVLPFLGVTLVAVAAGWGASRLFESMAAIFFVKLLVTATLYVAMLALLRCEIFFETCAFLSAMLRRKGGGQ